MFFLAIVQSVFNKCPVYGKKHFNQENLFEKTSRATTGTRTESLSKKNVVSLILSVLSDSASSRADEKSTIKMGKLVRNNQNIATTHPETVAPTSRPPKI